MSQRAAPAAKDDVAAERAVRQFLARAASVILESRTLDGVRFDEVIALADDAGLSRQRLSCELRFLQLRGVIDSFPSQQLDTADAALPARSDGIPSQPERAPPGTAAPAEAFRRWVQQKLAGYPSVVLAEDDERGLIGVGTHRYRLADLLARHIVRDGATARGMRLARDVDAASCHATVSESASDDVRLQAFFQQAAPVLAQHGGANAESRRLIQALAQQFHLTDAELDRALTALQPSATGMAVSDPRQQERRESYRSYLRRTMAQLPDGIVPVQQQRRLVEAGECFYGVAPEWIWPTIREAAGEMGARFVSRDQARRHVANLVRDIAVSGQLTEASARARVYAVGTRWGLDPIDVDLILRRQTERVGPQVAVERRATQWILVAATAAFLGGAVLLLGLIVPRSWTLAPVSPPDSASTRAPARAEPLPADGAAWWDDEIRVGVAGARRAHPELRSLLEQACSAEAAGRGAAYERLAAWYVQEGGSPPSAAFEALLAAWFAREPNAAAAARIPAALLAPSVALDAGLPRDAPGLAAAFRGARAAARVARQPALAAQRRAQLAPLFASALRLPPTSARSAAEVPGEAVASLARRCYAALERLAAEQPERVEPLYLALAVEASAHLDDTTRHQLDAALLAALLPPLGPQWVPYQDALRRTARSADPRVLQTLLDLFSRATDPRLRGVLVECFAAHLGVAPGSRTDLETVAALRQSLGLTPREPWQGRWNQVEAEAEARLARAAVAEQDPARVLQETVDLARLSALACALAQGAAGGGVFEELESAGPGRLDAPAARAVDTPAEPFVAPYPLPPSILLRYYIDKLASSRAPQARIALLRMMATAAESVPDLDPAAGQTLAEYLWRAKPPEEQQEVLAHLPTFARWNALRLGVADQMAVASPRESHPQAIARVLCGREVDLADASDRQAARQQLLANVLSAAPEAAGAGSASERVFAAAQSALGHCYQVQARLLGAPPPCAANGDDVTAALTALITHVAGTLDRARLTPAEQRLVAALPEQLAAAAFAAESDLHDAVLLQQIWLQILSAHLAQSRPAAAGSVRAITDEARAAAQASPRVDQQLRVLEAGLLRLWLLSRPDPATPTTVAHPRQGTPVMFRPRHLALATLSLVAWCAAAERAGAVIIRVRGQDQPIRGTLLRENQHVVVVRAVQPDGTATERTLPRSQVEDLFRAVDPARLAALDPTHPEAYRAYADELAAKRLDLEAQATAIRLLQIAATLDPERLGPSCLRGLIPLARNDAEQRRFRAMAYLSDPRHDPALLQIAPPPSPRPAPLAPARAEPLLQALRALRQGRRADALAQARRSKLADRLPRLTDAITAAEFEQACQTPCAACTRGRQVCSTCRGARFATGAGAARIPCPTCHGRGETVCPACGGNFQSPPLPDSLRRRIVQLEWQWLSGAGAPAAAPPAARPNWAQAARDGQLAPARELTLESLTEFNPRQRRFRDGAWVE